jgi:hypothetical protein
LTFRDRLLGTLRQLRPVLQEAGVLVVGSEVPNLLQPDAAATLVVSQDVDLAIPLERVEAVKRRLPEIRGLVPSGEEPSVLVPTTADLIEANFLGLDPRTREPGETYVYEDPILPLMVFGPLGLLRPGRVLAVDDLRLPLPRIADLVAEKLLTDRTGEKGDRDLLVVAGLLRHAAAADLDEFVTVVCALSRESRYTIQSNLTVLSLMDGRPGMPDPAPAREQIRLALARLGEDLA